MAIHKVVHVDNIGKGLVVEEGKLNVAIDEATLAITADGKLQAKAVNTADIHLGNVTLEGSKLKFDMEGSDDKELDLASIKPSEAEIRTAVLGDEVQDLAGNSLGFLVKKA